MILDYAYNKSKRIMSISYVTEKGGKKILDLNVNRFKTYYSTSKGKFTNWDGTKCDVKWTESPDMFDIKTYMEEMPEQYKKLLTGKTSPKLYTFDIEIDIDPDTFPEPSEAKFPISTISIASPDCNVIVLGTKDLGEGGEDYLTKSYNDYMRNTKFFMGLGMPIPYIKYIKFDSEEAMLRYFLQHIVSVVPVLAGWNSLLFDWQYIQNRTKFYYPNIPFSCCSKNWMMTGKNVTDMRGDKVRLTLPNHTLILDMMDVVGTFDMVVMPIKESLSLDYIAHESMGINKIEYDGSLYDLYHKDYQKYVFYNAIDSVLVQLIDKRFKTLQNIYVQALYCREKIGSCFSKIAISEALVFNDFFEHDIKIVSGNYTEPERGTLVGAYVKKPMPGKHKFISCNDFASLYPTGIITCNISYENYIGHDFTDEELDEFRNDPNYFVSINNNVYKNDQDYSFKRIQAKLKANRNTGKYLAKQLEADVVTDIDHILKDRKAFIAKGNHVYAENLVKGMEDIGYTIKTSQDILDHDDEWIKVFRKKLKSEIEYQTAFEQGMKLLGNSMYGGSSHVAFFWYNMNLANDITGEGRNLIHMMEKHIPEYWKNNWENLTEVHKMLGVEVDKTKTKKIIEQYGSFVEMVYGDTDSLYISYEPMLKSLKGYEKMTTSQKADILIKLNTDFLDNHNKEYMDAYYKSRHVVSAHKFELETLALSGVWLDVKKRYAQILLWKDGKRYDMDDLPMKIKGLEIIKSSYPKQVRIGLKRLVRFLLEDEGEDYLLQRLNIQVQKEKDKFYKADIEDICANMKVNNYTKYIIDDTDPKELKFTLGCPANVKAAGNYNRIRNVYNLPGEPIYGGKVKIYNYHPYGTVKADNLETFAFQATQYPKWADKYAPIDKEVMFQKYMLDPFNRILEAIGMQTLNSDGSIELNLFNF